MGMCAVKKVSQSKKPHPNRLTRTDAGAAHLLKKFNQAKIPKGGSFFGGAQLGMTRVLSEAKRISFHTVNIEYN